MAKAKKPRQRPVGKEQWSKSRVVLAITAAAGVVTSLYLASVHVDVALGAGLDGICNISDTFNCAATAQSSYSTVLGIPIALLGLGFYLGALALTVWGRSGRGDWDGSEFAAGRVLLVLFGFSLLYSIFLAVVSATSVGSFCPACTALYAVNAVGFGAAWFWSGTRIDRALVAQLRSITSLPSAPAAWGFVVLFGLSVAVSDGVVSSKISDARRTARGQANSGRPMEPPVDPSRLHAGYAPSKGPADAPVNVVVFSNPECPHCATLDRTLDEILAAFPEAVRVEYRHSVNPERAAAGLAAVCAQMQGRYFPMVEELFKNIPVRSQGDLENRMRRAGLDVSAMQSCMSSVEAQTTLQNDLEAAHLLGVRGTPTFFVNGVRYVGALSFNELSGIVRDQMQKARTAGAP